jgi:uncharacterized protein (TIGR02246 family)
MKPLQSSLAFMYFSFLVLMPVASQNSDNKESKEIAAIKQLSHDLDAAWNKYDAAAFSALFLDNADFQYWDGALLKDRNEIEQYYSTKVFKNMQPGMRHTSTLQRIRFVRKDVVIGDGTLNISREGAKENEKPALSALFTCVAQKKNGQWRIAAVRLMFPASK